jgi:hypothetical protein
VLDGLRARFGRRLPLEFRMHAVFFQPAVLRLLPARDCGYAIKVGYWSWLPLKQLPDHARPSASRNLVDRVGGSILNVRAIRV